MCTEANGMWGRLRGLTLVETIVSLLVISVGVVGVLSTMNVSIRHGADPMRQKQMTAIAESLLAEVLQQPFTFCDPDDPRASTATLSGTTPTCDNPANDQNKGGGALTSATPAGETRLSFDNVADYGGWSVNPVSDVSGIASSEVAGYKARVDIDRVGSSLFALPAAEDGAVLRATVTVSTIDNSESFSLSGYRFRYAPRY